MLTLEQAQERVLALAPQMPVETLASEAAVGRFLADDLRALRTQPPADLSAMDGYAIGGDFNGPWKLVGESRAGKPFDRELRTGETVRISTGAHMPDGADRVLIQENAQIEGDTVTCAEDFPAALRHVRQRGFDFSQGDLVLPAGTRIGPAQLALAIGAGHAQLEVRRAPRIAVLDSGDELVSDPAQCGDHQIPASNGAMLAAMAAPHTSEVRALGPVPDRLEAILDAFDAASNCDVIVTTGGASVGDHDLIRPALEQWGAKLDFWRVAIKPGKPLMVGRKGSQIILGLPGNPGSAYVTAFLFLLPLLRGLAGSPSPRPATIALPTASAIGPGHKRREFLRAVLREGTVEPLGDQDSSGMHALAIANALIERPAMADEVKAGTSVPVYLLQNGGIA